MQDKYNANTVQKLLINIKNFEVSSCNNISAGVYSNLADAFSVNRWANGGNTEAATKKGDTIMKNLINLFKDENGATAIEYGLIAALISVAAIGAMTALGTQLSTTFGDVTASLAAV